MSFHNNAIFWVEVDKIKPNPFQPRRDFDEGKLFELADSVRQYGVLQPLVVTRKEIDLEEGGMVVEYELIAGERRLRASKIAGVREVPVVIRDGGNDDRIKLELAIIENLQREDLNPVDRARAFDRLAKDFGYKHTEIGKKIGRSREFVSNTIRLLGLSEEMLQALSAGKISEGHTRPLLMLVDRPDEQKTLFTEIILKRMTVRDAEEISRRIAFDRVRKNDRAIHPQIFEFEETASQSLGKRVQIRRGAIGGKVLIDFVSDDDLREIIEILRSRNAPSDIGIQEVPAEGVLRVSIESEQPVMETVSEPALEKKDEEDVFGLGSFSI